MYEDLLNHNKLGNKQELVFFLFEALKSKKNQQIKDLHTFATSHIFSIALSFNGILKLFEFLSLIRIDSGIVIPNQELFNYIHTQSKKDYFEKNHFFELLIGKLIENDALSELFNSDNVKFNSNLEMFYIEDMSISLKAYPLRNLLLQTNFFNVIADIPNHLFIDKKFSILLKSKVIPNIQSLERTLKLKLETLKKSLARKEELGKQAEMFVMDYENKRLHNHPQRNKIERISDVFTNAGFDIQSFENNSSFFHDRYIEVKSYSEDISFYWSKNEIEVAKELGEKYFIYLVDRSKLTNSDYVPKIYQNPYKRIFNSNLWKKEAESWKIAFANNNED